jgi:hypothetical protein
LDLNEPALPDPGVAGVTAEAGGLVVVVVAAPAMPLIPSATPAAPPPTSPTTKLAAAKRLPMQSPFRPRTDAVTTESMSAAAVGNLDIG